jgi:hypothetical protein
MIAAKSPKVRAAAGALITSDLHLRNENLTTCAIGPRVKVQRAVPDLDLTLILMKKFVPKENCFRRCGRIIFRNTNQNAQWWRNFIAKFGPSVKIDIKKRGDAELARNAPPRGYRFAHPIRQVEIHCQVVCLENMARHHRDRFIYRQDCNDSRRRAGAATIPTGFGGPTGHPNAFANWIQEQSNLR